MTNQKKFLYKAFAVLMSAVVFLGGCSSKSKSENANANAAAGAQSGPFQVTTAQAAVREIPTYIQGTGSFVASETSDVSPKVSGQVVSTSVEVGDYVRQGQTIARLDDRDARLRLEQSKAAENQAEAAVKQAAARLGISPNGKFEAAAAPEVQSAYQNYLALVQDAKLAAVNEQRYANLLKTGDTSRLTYDQQRTTAETTNARAKAALKTYENAKNVAAQNYQGIASAQAGLATARAQVNIADKAIADAVIYAPFAGSIEARPVAQGEYVTSSSKIAVIVRTSPIKLSLPLPETDAGRIRTGMSVTASVPGYPNRNFAGQVSAITPSLDVSSRSLIVEARFDNSENLLRPGMFGTARILLPTSDKGVFVPTAAVMTDSTTQSSSVYVVENGTARLRVVQIGEQEGDNTRIVAGIAENDSVATSNLEELYDGAKVTR